MDNDIPPPPPALPVPAGKHGVAHACVAGVVLFVTAWNLVPVVTGYLSNIWDYDFFGRFFCAWALFFVSLAVARLLGLPVRWPWLAAFLAYAAGASWINAYLVWAITASC